MWVKLNDENIGNIKKGTLLSQKHPDVDTIQIEEIQVSLETIYKIEHINDEIDEIILKTEKVSQFVGITGSRTSNRHKLILEGWFAWL